MSNAQGGPLFTFPFPIRESEIFFKCCEAVGILYSLGYVDWIMEHVEVLSVR